MMKRGLDCVLALIGLIVAAAPMLLIAAIVRGESPGPALFRQVRVGRDGVPFRILKFRTMRAAAGEPADPYGAERVTRFGAFLRRTKLDELPQLWNVLVGEMSLVGPRPELPEWTAVYPERDRRTVLSVRPGLTDFASIRYRDEDVLLRRAGDPDRLYRQVILPRKLAYCRFYVRRRSLVLDLAILLRTLAALLGFEGRRYRA